MMITGVACLCDRKDTDRCISYLMIDDDEYVNLCFVLDFKRLLPYKKECVRQLKKCCI